MTTPQQLPPQPLPALDDHLPRRVTVGAGTAIKIGFFAALRAMLFSLLLSVVLGIVLTAAGLALRPILAKLFGG